MNAQEDEISFEEMSGGASAPEPAKTKTEATSLSFEEMSGQSSKPVVKIKKTPIVSITPEGVKIPLVEKALNSKYAQKATKALEEVKKVENKSPRATALAAGKVLAGSVVDLADLTVQGIVGVAQNLFSSESKGFTEAGARQFVQTANKTAAVTASVRDVASRLTGINLAPKSQEEKAVANFLAVLPEASSVAGDSVYDMTGSALASGGAQAILMLAGMRPGVAMRVLRSPYELAKTQLSKVPSTKPVSPAVKAGAMKVEAAIDELAATKPEAAKAIAEHVGKADPGLQKYIEDKIAQFSKASEEELIEIGKKQAQWKLQEKQALTEQAALQLERAPDQGALDLGEGAVREQGAFSFEDVSGKPKLTEKGEPIQGEMDLYGARGKNLELGLDEGGQKQLRLKLEETATGLTETLRQIRQEFDNLSLEMRTPGPPVEGIKIKRSELPPIPNGMTRLFLANKAGVKGMETVRLSAKEAEQLNLPDPNSYRGQMAYVDVPIKDAAKISGIVPKEVLARARAMPTASKPPIHRADPVIYTDNGKPVTRSRVEAAFTLGRQLANKVPGATIVQGKLSEYYQQIIRTINPEAVGVEAKQAAAVLSKNIAIQMQKDSSFHYRAADRRKFWNHRADEASEFISKFEKGEKFDDPLLNRVAQTYTQWNEEIAANDAKVGVDYEPVDNYLYHVFEDSDAVSEYFSKKFGPKWNDPKFIKERGWKLYEEAVAAGFKPRYTNPEDIMLARQHASDVATMRIQTLRDLETSGLAKKIEKGEKAPDDFPSTEWRSPNGERFWVHNNANAVMHNAFNTTSLWGTKGMVGDAFRGAMFLKNATVPALLSFSLFHALHVATIHNVTGMVRAAEALLAGKMSLGQAMKEMGQATFYKGFISDPKSGHRLLNAYKGKIADADLTDADRLSLQYMAEGGMIPELSAQYKTNAVEAFHNAIQRGSKTAIWHAPFAGLAYIGKPMFEHWIPSLKIASYLKDVKTALDINPKLLDDPTARQVAFRKIAKSIDNRYGEMAYSTLFWNRWVKDLGVASTLSLGWNLGFIREYGGGMLDVGQFVKGSKGGIVQKVQEGQLHRPLFVTFYSAQSMAYAGLLTWALSGELPSSLLDWLYPKSGEQNPDGTPQRLTTMFYPREFAAIAKHIEHEGVIGGLSHTAMNKASPVMGLVHDWATNVDSFGSEISDPNSPAYKQMAQKIAYSLSTIQPIALEAIRSEQTEKPVKSALLNVAGFSPAPKYATETSIQGEIKQLYKTYNTKKQTPYEKARFSQAARDMRKAYEAEDMDRYEELLDGMIEKYDLNAKDRRRLQQTISKNINPYESMFKRLTWQQQWRLLDKMSEEERDIYIRISNKDKVRYRWQPPEDRDE